MRDEHSLCVWAGVGGGEGGGGRESSLGAPFRPEASSFGAPSCALGDDPLSSRRRTPDRRARTRGPGVHARQRQLCTHAHARSGATDVR